MAVKTFTFTLPLSRWHHVADRIASLATQFQGEAVKALGGTTLNTPLADQQITALRERGQKALKWAEQAREALQVVGAIRVALAEANAEQGITTKLAEAEALRRQIKAAEELASIDLVTRTPLENVNTALATQSTTRDLYRGGGVDVALVDSNSLDFLVDDLIQLKARVAVLTDSVATLNRAELGLDLPEALAQAAGVVNA